MLSEEFRAGHARTLSDDELREKLKSIEAQYQRTVDGIHACMRER